MPSILSDEDKQTVKRTVPKASNKIHAVAVARLYIAYPDRNRWTYTGLQGAAVLANDLVGNTLWIKLVDISVSITPPGDMARLTQLSLRIAASFGTRKSTIPSRTTKIASSFTPSSSRNVSRDCHSAMRRRPKHSRRRWTTARRMRTRTPGTSPSVHPWVMEQEMPQTAANTIIIMAMGC